ncbi:MAG: MFS transporter [Pseudomonadota bacterium]|jgi:MFS family permease|nr:MFS transporter [Pseudomonadota bacterium]
MRLDALRSRRYRRYWLGSIASVGATQLYLIAKGWLVFELSGSAWDLGLLGAAAALPTILATFAGGLIADRMNRRRVLIVTSSSIAVLLCLLATLDALELVRVWHVWAIAAILGLAHGFDFPARQAFFPSLIKPAQMMSAVALNSILWQATRMILPALAGVAIALTDTSIIFFVTALGFILMVKVLFGLDVDSHRPQSAKPLRELIEGIQFIVGQQLFYVLILLTWTGMFFGTAYFQILPLFAELLGSNERGYGLMVSFTGIGSVIGTLLVGRLQRHRHLGRIMFLSAALMPCALLVFAVITGTFKTYPAAFAASCASILIAAICNSVFLITSMTVLQLRVPEALRGRVMGIHSITFSLIGLGGLVIGLTASWLTAPIAVGIGASIVLICVVSAYFHFTSIRNLDGRSLTGSS